jgi:hypothetical protein
MDEFDRKVLRAATKERQEAYRSAARTIAMTVGGTVRTMASVVETIDGDGAFVEIIVFVGKDQLS